ncbi:MAG: polyphenol oxidase family protein [Candidatus Hydrogenedentota bacterium]
MEAITAFSFDDMTLPDQGGEFDLALQNYFSFIRRFGLRDGCVARQVHGASIIEAAGLPRTRPIFPVVYGEADAIWTAEPDVWVGVYTADCLPLLLDAGERVMAVHAGWRGLAAGIISNAIEAAGGASRVKSVTLGPAAAGCCYEVGGEVLDAIDKAGIEPVSSGRNLDLPLTAERHLRALGVGTILRSDPFGCTICDRRFRSYRRDGDCSGRNLSVIALKN